MNNKTKQASNQPAQQQNPIEPIEFLSSFQTEKLAIERGIEWTPAIHDLCNRAIEEEKLAEQPAQQECVACKRKDTLLEMSLATIEALREQPAQQEPVAWATQMGEYAHIHWGAKRPEYPMVYEFPLYTSPPASKPWVGLTTEDRKQLLHDHHPDIDPVAFFDAIETKLREKNA